MWLPIIIVFLAVLTFAAWAADTKPVQRLAKKLEKKLERL
jgi:hypothetical protein